MPDTSQIMLVALTDLRDPDWNPRDSFDEDEMQSLMDFIQAGGRIPPIVIWTPSPENAGGEPTEVPFSIISGTRRREAYRRLGRTHIEAIPMDIPLEDAMFMALAANKDSKPFWLREYIRVENLIKRNDKLKQVEIKARTGWSKTRVSRAINLILLLNSASRALINQPNPKKVSARNFSDNENDRNSTKPDIWRLTEDVAIRLIPLWDENNPETSQTRAEQVVRKVIENQLTGPQTDDLVAHTLAGNDPAQFEPAAKVRKPRSKTGTTHEPHSPLPSELADNVVELGPNTAPTHAKANTSAAVHTPSPQTKAAPEGMSETEQLAWEALAGISLINQIKSKIKKGERPTVAEFFMLVGHYFKKPFEWLVKHGIKGIFHAIKWVGKTFIESLKVTGLYPFFRSVFFLASFAFIVWFGWEAYHYGVMRPVKMIGARLPLISGFFTSSPQAPAQTPQPAPAVSTAAPPVVAKAPAKPRIIAAPAVIAYTENGDNAESKTNIDAELAAIPPNSLIKPFLYKPGAMNFDMASRRLEDLQDTEKYTVRLGSDREKIINTMMTASNCVFTVQSGLIGLLSNTSRIEFYWEDVKEIHTSEIVTALNGNNKRVMYQCSLLATGLKKPFTVQCATAENLERLVSALEFKLQTSRGSTAPITAMPYLNQGIRLNNDGIVTTLWTNSPADKAGLVLGDIIWSVEKNTEKQTGKNELEAGLQSLTPGPHILYKVPAAGWKRAEENLKHGVTDILRPLRRTVHLVTQ